MDARIVGDVVFSQPVGSAFWVHGGWGQIWLLDFYTPPPLEVVAGGQLQWERLENHIALNTPSAARAQTRLNALRSALAAPVALVNKLLGSQEYRLMASGLSSITAAVAQFAKESWPDPQEELDAADAKAASDADAAAAAAKAAADRRDAAAAKAIADKKIADAKAQGTQDSIAAAKAAIAAAERAKLVSQHSAATAAEKGGTSPLVIAAIAVPVLGVLVYAFSQRGGKSVSGYRRRRRR